LGSDVSKLRDDARVLALDTSLNHRTTDVTARIAGVNVARASLMDTGGALGRNFRLLC
jgi:hypothetical protein